MSGLEPVIIPMVVGGGLGAAMDRQNPLRGAALGAVGGWAAAPALGAAAGSLGLGAAGATPAAGAAGAAGAAEAGLAPVVTAGVDSGGTVLAGMNQGANLLTTPFAKGLDALMGSQASKGMQLARLGMGMMNRPQQQSMPVGGGGGGGAAPRMGGGGESFAAISPFSSAGQAPYDDLRRRQMMMAARMPGIIGNNPYGSTYG